LQSKFKKIRCSRTRTLQKYSLAQENSRNARTQLEFGGAQERTQNLPENAISVSLAAQYFSKSFRNTTCRDDMPLRSGNSESLAESTHDILRIFTQRIHCL
jgi:hypothetical protein